VGCAASDCAVRGCASAMRCTAGQFDSSRQAGRVGPAQVRRSKPDQNISDCRPAHTICTFVCPCTPPEITTSLAAATVRRLGADRVGRGGSCVGRGAAGSAAGGRRILDGGVRRDSSAGAVPVRDDVARWRSSACCRSASIRGHRRWHRQLHEEGLHVRPRDVARTRCSAAAPPWP
jgi:hypothetical protein